MARSDFTFFYPKRVRFAEIDAQAVLFNSRYLEYFDIGLVEYWRAVGMYENMGIVGGLEFHVAKALVNYKAAIGLDEVIDIGVRCARIGNSSMTVAFELHASGKDDLRATGEEVHVHVAEVRGRPTPLPQHVIDLFEKFEGRSLREGVPA
ncbi:acyl-CoA thioesterase [Polymorphobacter arshaanensis]|uniref:Acyl-CoA thioesterase n=1 Tax=Glacieibacterium arshaanense TaxID=2511025 RepID=A0A4Y9EL50_9SPHN|nr:thioesterase family protein [Polymorphobacter arshaanensis]TFU01146.1 acyl-CoA thioesterase [Polymorphobacter arshaanensis]